MGRVHRFDLPDIADDALFRYARNARSKLRRFACYGLLLYLPLAVLPYLYTPTLSYAQTVFIAVMGTLSAMLLIASIAINQNPRAATRMMILALIPLAPIIAIALFHGRKAQRGNAAASVNLFLTLPLFDEVAIRLDRDPDGAAQRDWLGLAPRPGAFHSDDSWADRGRSS
jgi:hypothetical protein